MQLTRWTILAAAVAATLSACSASPGDTAVTATATAAPDASEATEPVSPAPPQGTPASPAPTVPRSTPPAATPTPTPRASTTPTPSPVASPTPTREPAPPTTVAVDVFDYGYDPAERQVAVGDTVRWTNVGDFAHTVTFSGSGPDSGSLSGGEAFEATFEQPGTFNYRCLFHSQMQGTVIVA